MRIEAAFEDTLAEVELLSPTPRAPACTSSTRWPASLERTEREDGVLVHAKVPAPSCTASTTSPSL